MPTRAAVKSPGTSWRPSAPAPDHHDVVAEAQLGVGDRAVGIVVAGEGLEAERALEEVDRGGGVAVEEGGMDGSCEPG